MSFIDDLDNYIAEKYENFNAITALKGFYAPAKAALKRVYINDEATYNYKPENSFFKISDQKNKPQILSELKQLYKDFNEVFNAYPIPFNKKVKIFFIPKLKFGLKIKQVLKKYGGYTNLAQLFSNENLLERITASKLYPSKKAVFKICLFLGLNQTDCQSIMKLFDYDFDNKSVPELIVKYLIENKIFNKELINQAFTEYKIAPLF